MRPLLGLCLLVGCTAVTPRWEHDRDLVACDWAEEGAEVIAEPVPAITWQSHVPYKVRRGDSLSKIARRFATSVRALRRDNKIRGSLIRVGQELRIPQRPPITHFLDHEMADVLAHHSLRYATARKSSKLCLRGVRLALTRTLRELGHIDQPRISLGRSARRFHRWARNNPRHLCRSYRLMPMGLRRSKKPIPLINGLIYVYSPGRCGFDRRYGHIEVVADADSRRVCSDHCRVLKARPCRPDMVLAPVQQCTFESGPILLASAGEPA